MPLPPDTLALVTGAAQGIGRAIAERLARDGARLALLDREDAAETAALVGGATVLRADITDAAAVTAAVEPLGAVGVLVNNAAWTVHGDLARMPLEGWHREVDVNLNGAYHVLRAVLPGMAARGRGAIVNVGSVNGVRAFGNPAYSAAKAGLVNLTQAVAAEYGPRGVRCNAVLPGSVRTGADSWRLRQERDPAVFEKLAKWYPLGRVGAPEDVANAVAFLCSDEAAWITGVALPVDGGLLAGMNVMTAEFVLE